MRPLGCNRSRGQLGLPRQRFHDLRCFCATRWREQGGSPCTVDALPGHPRISLAKNAAVPVMPKLRPDAVNLTERILTASASSSCAV